MTPHEIVLIEGGPDDDRDPHLTYAELEAWVDGRLSPIDRELIEGHFDLCVLCRAEAADLARVRDCLPVRPVRRRRAPHTAVPR